MNSAHAQAFLQEYSETFPESLLSRYEPLECLSSSGHCQTYLMEEKAGGRLVVAKAYRKADVPAGESSLSGLSHPGIPAHVETIADGDMLYILREYVHGVTLDQYVQKPLPEKEAIAIALSLCDILIYLGSLDPPIIHRDIKPSNIVLDPDTGSLTLIDFSIARTYTLGAGSDTVCMGSQHFSPPEQFGFAQTDKRADIYALGVLLLWLLTMDSKLPGAMKKLSMGGLKKIIRRLTAFDPEKRFQSARHAKRALLAYEKGVKPKALAVAACLALSMALLAAGFYAGRYTKISIPLFGSLLDQAEAVVFHDPVLEGKVRASLAMKEGAITVAQVRAVTGLDASQSMPGVQEELKIRDISALAHFVNLSTLNLDWNDISDIAPLTGLDGLTKLQLNGNGNITDFAPLKGLTKLRELRLVGCQVTNATMQLFAGMTQLEELWVESPRLKDISIVRCFPNLRRLELKQCLISDISPLTELASLTDLGLEGNPLHDITPLLKLPSLAFVNLSEGMRKLAEEQLSGATFTITYH